MSNNDLVPLAVGLPVHQPIVNVDEVIPSSSSKEEVPDEVFDDHGIEGTSSVQEEEEDWLLTGVQ